MKKVIIIAMLLSVLCVCGLSAGVCFADETSSQMYYFEKTQDTPNLPMRAEASADGKVLLYIPHSYAFEKLQDPENGYVKINYNGQVGYIQTSDFNSCKQVTSKWGDNVYAYEFPNVTVAVDNVTLYKKEDMSNLGSSNKDAFTINKVYGYYFIGNDYYFLADTTTVLYDTEFPKQGYIKASETSLAGFTAESIPNSKGYTLQTTPDKQPDEVINSGNVDNTTNPPQSTNNNLDRYILIAVIAVLCVVIMILIFVPNRKRQN